MNKSASPGYLVRDAVAEDAPALARLKLACFRETFLEDFAIPYPKDDLALFEEESYSLARVEAELADASHQTWLVEIDVGWLGLEGAQDTEDTEDTEERVLVAYAHIGPCKLPHDDVCEGDGELYQIYLRREVQGAGLGKRLLGLALDHLQSSCPRIWIGVWSGNDRARSFYAAHGFADVGAYQFSVGKWRDDEIIMRRDSHQWVTALSASGIVAA